MATIEIQDKELTIRLLGWDKLLAFKSRLTIPLDHVRSVTLRPSDAFGRGPITAWKVAGSYIPDVLSAGYFWVASGIRNNPKKALERLAKARESIEQLSAFEGGHRTRALELVDQASEELRKGAEELEIPPDDEGSGWAFYSVRDPEKTIGLELDHESIRHVVVEVDDLTPEEARQAILDAKSRSATYRTPG